MVQIFQRLGWQTEKQAPDLGSRVSGRGKGHAQLEKLGKGLGKVGAELVLVIFVLHNVLLESTIPEEAHVGGEHHPAE